MKEEVTVTKRYNLLILSIVFIVQIFIASNVYAHTDVTAEQARTMIETNPALLVVDVRTPEEYCDEVGHIPGAINLPWPDVFQQRYQEIPIDAEVLLVCHSGNRSQQAAAFLDSQGYQHVYDMTGGMSAWQWETVLCCSIWDNVVEKYNAYVSGIAAWDDVISCYSEYTQ